MNDFERIVSELMEPCIVIGCQYPDGHEGKHKLMSDDKVYYCYGSGMGGCLYDYGPNFCLDKEDAISSFVQLFGESLEPGELNEMVTNLKEDGIHYFRNAGECGAQYCQISEEIGEMPESDD
jgi:hypothetical protein